MGTLGQWTWVDKPVVFKDYMFLWPEKAYSCYISIHQEEKRINKPEGWKGHETSGSATVLSWGVFVNGHTAPVADPASGINLVVMVDDSIKATYTKWASRQRDKASKETNRQNYNSGRGVTSRPPCIV